MSAPPRFTSRRSIGLLALALLLACAADIRFALSGAAARAAVTREYESEARTPVAPGVFHDRGFIETDTAGRQAVRILEVDTEDPAITFEASISNDRVAGLETTTSQANRRDAEGHRAVGATNGDFWGTAQAPIGLHIQAAELVTAAASARPTFGIGEDGDPIIGSPSITAVAIAPDGARQRIARVNQPRAGGQLVLYTARFNATTGTDASGTEVVLADVALPIGTSGAYTGTASQIRRGAGNTPIGKDDVVLSGVGAPASFLNALAPGDRVELTFSITAGWEDVIHAVGGGQYIVRNGAVDIEPHNPPFADVTHPRTAIGLTADGDVVMATVDGRQPGYSIGVRLDELGELMIGRGAVTAINLDGGGSTTMAVRLPGDEGVTAVNRGSDGVERAVSNSLLVFSSAPTGPLALAHVVPPDASVLVGSRIEYTSRGQDAAYNPVAIAPGSVGWSVVGSAGTIDAAGRFTSTAAGTALVTATIGEVVGETGVTSVERLAALDVDPAYVIVQPGSTQAFTPVGRDKDGADVRVDATQATWSVDGPIGTIDRRGVLRAAGKPASGSVVAKAGGATGRARVDVGRAPEVLEDFEDISDMRAQAVGGTATLESAMRPDPVYAGIHSGRLAYAFTAGGTSAAYAAHSPWRELDGRPLRIGIWLFGDGSRHWVRGNYRDGSDTQRVVDFTAAPIPAPVTREDCVQRTGGIDWTGWRYIEAPIPADAALPLKWERVYLVETYDLCDTQSAVYLDDLRAVYSDTGGPLVGRALRDLLAKLRRRASVAKRDVIRTIRESPPLQR